VKAGTFTMNSKTNASEQSSEPLKITSAETSSVCQHCDAERSSREKTSLRIKYVLAVVSGVTLFLGVILQLMLLSDLVFYSLFIISILSAGRWIIPNGIRGLYKGHLGISALMTIAAIGAVLINEPAEGAAVMFLFYVAELLEEKAGDKVRTEIESLLELEPESVNVKNQESEIAISPDHVNIGQIFVVRPGERIGLDGTVIKGMSSVNQAPITGESIPVEKNIGDIVFAGTINIDGFFEIEVTKISQDSVLSRIVRLVQDARKAKSPTERFVSRFSHVYTPIVIAGAFLLGFGTFILGAPIHDAVYRGLTLLVISCPCAFAISIPVSMVSSIVGSAREGVLVKGSDHLEQLSRTKIVAFDKTGTLTRGNLTVQSICLHNGSSRQDVLSAAIALERMSEHPIAQALVDAGENDSVPILEAEEFVAIPGRGVKGRVGQVTYIVGNRRLLTAERIDLPTEGHVCGTGTMVYVVREKKHLGTVVLGDSIREGTIEAVQELQSQGIRTIMLTGDNEDVAAQIATELGFEEYFSELLPEQKVEFIQKLSEEGGIVMIGDGINDTPALAAADVGIAMGVISSDAAIETADIALMEEDLRKVPKLIQRAKRTMNIVRQNVILSISVKVIIGVLAVLGFTTLWMAILFGDMGLTLVVIANALRLTRRDK
ncbi:MAG: cation-translocating P-type ATPase, partial [Candidatus Thorarchaeota archaeon]|nr:cation-translocating P-type ATPase [Candidatus Thorarchaeota archaeon]